MGVVIIRKLRRKGRISNYPTPFANAKPNSATIGKNRPRNSIKINLTEKETN